MFLAQLFYFLKLDLMKNKLIKWENISHLISDLKLRKSDVIFTNGCFDIIHPGHIHILKEAKSYGDILIVGLNSNRSVKRLKGKSRPINSESDRVKILCSIKFVDYVVVFDEDTPLELIKLIKPDSLIKGGDYDKSDIIGADIVEKKGGRVIIVELLDNYSTSSIIDSFEK